MLRIVLWALATGFVTGAVWLAIVLLRREPAEDPPALPDSSQTDPAILDSMNRRLLELEERLDATEYRLKREKVEQPRNRVE